MEQVTRLITPTNEFDVQISDNDLGAWLPLGSFQAEKEAQEFFDRIKIRLVQRATILYEERKFDKPKPPVVAIGAGKDKTKPAND